MADAAPTDGMSGPLRRIFVNEYVAVLIRLTLGMVFLVASIEKVADPAAFASSINNYKLLSPAVSMALASTLPWVELLCAIALLFGVGARGSALLVSLLLAVFTVAVISALMRGLDISCGCFTQDPQAGKVAWEKVVENSIMLVAAVCLVVMPSAKLSLESFFATRSPDPHQRP